MWNFAPLMAGLGTFLIFYSYDKSPVAVGNEGELDNETEEANSQEYVPMPEDVTVVCIIH